MSTFQRPSSAKTCACTPDTHSSSSAEQDFSIAGLRALVFETTALGLTYVWRKYRRGRSFGVTAGVSVVGVQVCVVLCKASGKVMPKDMTRDTRSAGGFVFRKLKVHPGKGFQLQVPILGGVVLHFSQTAAAAGAATTHSHSHSQRMQRVEDKDRAPKLCVAVTLSPRDLGSRIFLPENYVCTYVFVHSSSFSREHSTEITTQVVTLYC